VRGAMRSGGSYAVGQARAELKYCDSSLLNVVLGTGAFGQQSKAQSAGSPANTTATIGLFTQWNSANVAPHAGFNGQPGIILNNITQGADATQRIGRKIQIKSIRVLASVQVSSYWTNLNSAAGTSYNQTNYCENQTARLVLVWDKQPNGAICFSSDVFVEMNGNTPSSSMMNLNNRDRFVILADEKRSMGAGGNGTALFDIYKECDLTTIYSSAVDPQLIASIASGALYAFLLGDSPNGIANPAVAINPITLPGAYTTNAQVRLRYLDA